MSYEIELERYIHDLLSKVGIEEKSVSINFASKSQTGGIGFPDHFAIVKNFTLVMEDKSDITKLLHMDSNAGKKGEGWDIEDRQWKSFSIEEVAEICSGRDIYDAERIFGNIPYIGASSSNNGICHFISNKNETLEANCISVNRNGSVGYAFYHPYPALYSNDCRKLRPQVSNPFVSIFIAHQITMQREKFSYGYKMGTGRMKRQKILLPIDSNGNPDFEFMESYIQKIFSKIISRIYSELKSFEKLQNQN